MHPADYLPLLIFAAIALGIAGIFVVLSVALGPRKPSATKLSPFECGKEPAGTARQRVSVKFFVVALLFIAFDIAVAFLYPWGVLFRDFIAEGRGLLALGEALAFIVILGAGLVYAWRKGALEWD